jgi:hypothetical protein
MNYTNSSMTPADPEHRITKQAQTSGNNSSAHNKKVSVQMLLIEILYTYSVSEFH